jgi:NAD-dependent deacetylase
MLDQPLVILTGAGISAESGVPTFRGKGGLWRSYRPESLATPQAFSQDPGLVWAFYAWRRELVAQCHPNRAHLTLVEIEKASPQFTLITQNVDGLHAQAGSLNVLEMHGSIWRLRCTNCGQRWEDRSAWPEGHVPVCEGCGSLARPDVVWFGESISGDVLEQALDRAQHARTFLVIGTSAVVRPAADLPLIAQAAGAQIVEFNLAPTPLTPRVDDFRSGLAGEQLLKWWQEQIHNSSVSAS